MCQLTSLGEFMFKYVFVFILISSEAFGKGFTNQEISTILNAMGGDGRKIESLLRDKRLKKTPGMVNQNITKPIKLSMKKYKHFLEPYAIGLAKKFMRKWKRPLKIAEKKYGVHDEVITAILLVETSFGRFTGKFQPLSVFASMFVDIDAFMKSEKSNHLEKKLQARFEKKKAWALSELRAIASLSQKYPDLNQLKLRGSYAGAFGKCQFLPSSFLTFCVSYRGRGTPNLFEEKGCHSFRRKLS